MLALLNETLCELANLARLARGPIEAAPNALVNRGHKATICADQKPKRIVDLSARCVAGRELAILFGVRGKCAEHPCELVDPFTGLLAPRTLLYANVHWGVGGVGFDATFDVRRGCVVFLPAETLYVDVGMRALLPRGVAPENASLVADPDPVEVSVGFAYGASSVQQAARLTVPVTVPAFNGADGSVLVPVPPYASGFALVPCAGSTLTAQVVTDGGPGPFPTYTASTPTETFFGFPLSNGARSLRLTNATDAPALGDVIFGLDL